MASGFLALLIILISLLAQVTAQGPCVVRFEIVQALSAFTLNGTSSRPVALPISLVDNSTITLAGSLYLSLSSSTICPPSSLTSTTFNGASFVAPPASSPPYPPLSFSAPIISTKAGAGSLSFANVDFVDLGMSVVSGPATEVARAPQNWTIVQGMSRASAPLILSETLYTDLYGTSAAVDTAGSLVVTNQTATLDLPSVTWSLDLKGIAADQAATYSFRGRLVATFTAGCPLGCSLRGGCSTFGGGPPSCNCDCGWGGPGCGTATLPPLQVELVQASNATAIQIIGPDIARPNAPPLQVQLDNITCTPVAALSPSVASCNIPPLTSPPSRLLASVSRGCQSAPRTLASLVSISPPSGNTTAAVCAPQECAGARSRECQAVPLRAREIGPCTCVCNEGWTGPDCGVCTASSACQASGLGSRCEVAPYYGPNTTLKAYSCQLSSNGLTQYVSDRLSATCHAGNRTCSLGLQLIADSQMTAVTCTASKCALLVGRGEITCEETACTCGSEKVACPSSLQQTIPDIRGQARMDCGGALPGLDGSQKCVFSMDVLPVDLEATCQIGECTDVSTIVAAKALSSESVNALAAGLAVSLSAVAAALVLLLAVLGRRHQRRCGEDKYLALLAAQKKTPPGGGGGDPRGGCTLTVRGLAVGVSQGGWLSKTWGVCPGSNQAGSWQWIISGVEFSVSSGELLAVFGPSGSGKTTLLNVLAGVHSGGTATYGEVLVDGAPRGEGFRKLAAYLPQEDYLYDTLTAEESIAYSAELRLPAFMPRRMKQDRVDAVINQLGLDQVRKNRVGGFMGGGGLSGGEKRRVRIGMELVSDPRVLLLDEPTSGLDSHNTLRLVQQLRAAAGEEGRLVVLSVHQPSEEVFALFDRVLLLSKHGGVLYFGSREALPAFFAAQGHPCPPGRNFADHMVAVASQFPTAFKAPPPRIPPPTLAIPSTPPHPTDQSQPSPLQHPSAPLLPPPPTTTTPKTPPPNTPGAITSKPSLLTELRVLFRRELRNVVRHPGLLGVHFLVSLGLGLLVGAVFWDVPGDLAGFQNRAGALYFSVIFFALSSLSALAPLITERIIFTQESAGGYYRPVSYFLPKVTLDALFLRLIPALVFGTCLYQLMGLRNEGGRFGVFLGVLFLVAVVSGALFMFLSLLVTSVAVANVLAIVVLLIFLCFGGYLVNEESIPSWLKWLPKVSFFTFAFEALMVNELKGLTFTFVPPGLGPVITLKGDVFLQTLNLRKDHLGRDVAVLAGMACGYWILTCLLLHARVRRAIRLATRAASQSDYIEGENQSDSRVELASSQAVRQSQDGRSSDRVNCDA